MEERDLRVMPFVVIDSSYPSGGSPATFSSFGGFLSKYSPPVARISRGAGMSVAFLGMAPAKAPTDKVVVMTRFVTVFSFMSLIFSMYFR